MCAAKPKVIYSIFNKITSIYQLVGQTPLSNLVTLPGYRNILTLKDSKKKEEKMVAS